MDIVEEEVKEFTSPNGGVPPSNVGTDLYVPYAQHSVKIHHDVLTAASVSAVLFKDLFLEFMTDANLTLLSGKLKNFTFTQSNLKIRIVVQGQPFAAGQVIYAFTPRVFAPELITPTYTTSALSVPNSKIVPHITIDPSKNATYEISLPPPTTTGYYDMSTAATVHGSYSCTRIVFNSLISGTATVPTVGICIYASLENPNFGGMTYLGDFQKEETAPLSAIAHNFSKFVGKVGTVFPPLKAITTVVSSVGGAVGDVLHFFGFSKPQLIEVNLMPLTRTTDNHTQFNGPSTSYSLSGDCKNSVSISEKLIGSNNNELSLEYLCSIPCLIAQLSITTALAAGAAIPSPIPVAPTFSFRDIALTSCPTPLGGVAACFDSWCGDITYRIEIVASVFHRCTILVAYEPTVNTAPTFDVAVALLKNTTIVISGNTCTDITVPWSSSSVWKSMPIISSVAASYTVANSNGFLHFFVVNALTSNGSTNPIPINVYAYSKNIKFNIPDTSDISLYNVRAELLGYYQEESNPLVETCHVSFGPKTDLTYLDHFAMGESYTSIKHLTSKLHSSMIGNLAVPPSSLSFLRYRIANIPLTKFDTTIYGAVPQYQNFTAWFAGAFVGYRGSMKYNMHFILLDTSGYAVSTQVKERDDVVIIHDHERLLANSYQILSAALNSDQRAYAYHFVNLAVSSAVEFSANQLHHYRFAPTRLVFTNYSDNTTVVYTTDSSAGSYTAVTHENTATGDDGVFHWFVGFPIIIST